MSHDCYAITIAFPGGGVRVRIVPRPPAIRVFFYFIFWLLLHLRPNYIHSASNDIHTDGPRATARARG